ncbi:MAG: exodeoxyribonuclease VII small subunit [Proteobacteria bacterium]|nr:exodeoxyribonuclease VII small subunit [Pseudomonadota bacterium]
MTEKLSFEQQMGELEKLVARLERGEMPLDESLVAFERGMKLVALCREELARAELQVDKVVSAAGATVPFGGA